MLLNEFDPSAAIIEPGKTLKRLPDMPKVCIGVFSHVLVEEWAARHQAALVTRLESVAGDIPVYRFTAAGQEYALFVPCVGAPAAAGCLEELIARGAAHFVFCGCCGVLRHDIADGHLIVPTAALRDEGLSYHYAPPSDEIALDARMVDLAAAELDALGLPYIRGKAWTTDAFYRETKQKMERAKAMGAVCVDMECAALAAVAAFRGVDFCQFFWSADNLDAPAWDQRSLSSKGRSIGETCLLAALAIARRLVPPPPD
jgi:uridine phosphorylase